MNYELAKQLKDAGFPQIWREGCDFYWTETKELEKEACSDIGRDGDLRDCGIKVPSLLELIEACGDKFEYLIQIFDRNGVDKKEWCAHAFGQLACYDETMEGAVANLWLELNKKS